MNEQTVLESPAATAWTVLLNKDGIATKVPADGVEVRQAQLRLTVTRVLASLDVDIPAGHALVIRTALEATVWSGWRFHFQEGG